MSEIINWTTIASILGGPVINKSGQITADGYHKFEAVLEAGVSKTLSLAPGFWNELEFLMISPAASGAGLSYNSGAGDVVLETPLLLIGKSATALFGTGNASLTLKNSGASAIAVDIVVARNN